MCLYDCASLRTSSTSVQWVPLPSMPSGHGPHCTPWGVSKQLTPGWQGLGTQEGRGSIPPIPEDRRHQPSTISDKLRRLQTRLKSIWLCCSTHYRLRTPSRCSSGTLPPLSEKYSQLKHDVNSVLSNQVRLLLTTVAQSGCRRQNVFFSPAVLAAL